MLTVPPLLLCLNGCAAPYDPPIQGDHAAEQYKTDLKTCTATATETIRRRNADTPWTWIRSGFTGSSEVRVATRTCMTGKGYVLENPGG